MDKPLDKVKIKNEYQPKRCEVCHQSDCYDPSSNYCSRCSGLIINNSSGLATLEFDNLKQNNLKHTYDIDIHYRFRSFVNAMFALGFFISTISFGVLVLINIFPSKSLVWQRGIDAVIALIELVVEPIAYLFRPVFELFGIGYYESLAYLFFISFCLMVYSSLKLKLSRCRQSLQ
ncbi:MAG: hypothetical protein AB1489_23630 [Acidobacteriota bacterium]